MKPLSPSASITRYGEVPGTSTGLEDLVPKKNNGNTNIV